VDGSFSSGSSSCPVGLPQPGGVAVSGYVDFRIQYERTNENLAQQLRGAVLKRAVVLRMRLQMRRNQQAARRLLLLRPLLTAIHRLLARALPPGLLLHPFTLARRLIPRRRLRHCHRHSHSHTALLLCHCTMGVSSASCQASPCALPSFDGHWTFC
jgi:hypothetical protein